MIVADLQRSGGEGPYSGTEVRKRNPAHPFLGMQATLQCVSEVHDLTESQQRSFTNLFIGSVACTTACMGGQMTTQGSLVSPSST